MMIKWYKWNTCSIFLILYIQDMDKQKRTLIHNWIRNRYNGLLDSETVASVIRVLVSNKRIR